MIVEGTALRGTVSWLQSHNTITTVTGAEFEAEGLELGEWLASISQPGGKSTEHRHGYGWALLED